MTKVTARMIWLGALAACGSSSSKTPDAASNVPAMITITGTTSERTLTNPGGAAIAGVMVAAYNSSDPSTAIATATSDGSGNYSLTAPTGGKPVDGYVKATHTGDLDVYLYPPAPLDADFSGASINLVTQQVADFASTACHGNQDSSKGTIAVEVVDGSGMTVAGATVSSSPAASAYCYDMSGFPNSMATASDTDGVAVMFNVTGQVSVSASKSGATFKTHTVNAVAGAFTTTLITE